MLTSVCTCLVIQAMTRNKVCFLCATSRQRTCSVTRLPLGLSICLSPSLISLFFFLLSTFLSGLCNSSSCLKAQEGGRKLFKAPLLHRDQNTGETAVTVSGSSTFLDNRPVPSQTSCAALMVVISTSLCFRLSLSLPHTKQSASLTLAVPPFCSDFTMPRSVSLLI